MREQILQYIREMGGGVSFAELERELGELQARFNALQDEQERRFNVAQQIVTEREMFREKVDELQSEIQSHMQTDHQQDYDRIVEVLEREDALKECVEKLKRELRFMKREVRVLRNIVQRDGPDELDVVRGMREYNTNQRRKCRKAEARAEVLEKRLTESVLELRSMDNSPQAFMVWLANVLPAALPARSMEWLDAEKPSASEPTCEWCGGNGKEHKFGD